MKTSTLLRYLAVHRPQFLVATETWDNSSDKDIKKVYNDHYQLLLTDPAPYRGVALYYREGWTVKSVTKLLDYALFVTLEQAGTVVTILCVYVRVTDKNLYNSVKNILMSEYCERSAHLFICGDFNADIDKYDKLIDRFDWSKTKGVTHEVTRLGVTHQSRIDAVYATSPIHSQRRQKFANSDHFLLETNYVVRWQERFIKRRIMPRRKAIIKDVMSEKINIFTSAWPFVPLKKLLL